MIRLVFRILAVATVSLLVVALVANSRQPLMAPAQMTVRANIDAISLPPPPPPPTSHSEPQQAPKLNLQIGGQGPSLTLSKLQVAQSKPVLTKAMTKVQASDFSALDFNIDSSHFALNDLDKTPKLLTPLRIRFTPQMRRQGVKQVQVKLHVVINAQGQVRLQSITENDYPQLAPALIKLVNRAKFTAPMHQGKAVSAEFIWPLVLKESTY